MCQRRIGRGYKGFGCIKFRTMRRDADRVLLRMLANADPDLDEEFERDLKLKRDPRITRWASSCAAPASMNCPSSSTCCAVR